MKKFRFVLSLFVILLAFPLAFVLSACNGGGDGDASSSLMTFSNITFTSKTVDYDGTEHSILLNGDLPQGVSVVYSNNRGTNAGEYNASVTLSLEGYQSLTLTAKLTINKASYDMTMAHWDYESEFTYNGNEQSVAVVGLPQGVTVKQYQNNAKTNAGNYTASVTFNYDTVNHNAPTLADLNWTINKATYDITSARWDYESDYTYNGSEQSVEIVGLPQGVTAQYSNNVKTNAGSYTATAQLIYDTQNYNSISIQDLNWTINKASYDMQNAHWNYSNPFMYDETEKEVLLEGLPQGVTVLEYQNNKKTEAGTYTATVTLSYDTLNYNTISIDSCVWRILPDVSQVALNVLNSLMQVPDPWEFLPESFSLENKVYNGNTEIDFTNFVSVSSLPKQSMGKQMNVVYSTLIDVDNALGYLRYIYGSLGIIVNFYQDFINSNQDNYASYEKATDNFTFKIVLEDSDYQMFISYQSVAMEISYELATQKCYGRIQLTNSNVIKYEMAEDDLTIAINILGLSLTKLHFEREENLISGYLYEYYGTESTNVKTSALIKVDENYTSIISNKRETDDLSIEGYVEVYKNSTGNLVGAEVRETVKSVKYETSWFNLWDVTNINTIKVINEENGSNMDTIYINGSESPIKTKLVGGFSMRTASRRFDIEMKDVYLYTYNQDEEKYEKVKLSIPMLFVQNDFIDSFSEDFYEKNQNTGAISPTSITMNSDDSTFMFSEYANLIDEYLVIKEDVSYQSIIDYIGSENEYFNQ